MARMSSAVQDLRRYVPPIDYQGRDKCAEIAVDGSYEEIKTFFRNVNKEYTRTYTSRRMSNLKQKNTYIGIYLWYLYIEFKRKLLSGCS